jgi:hypothetical protein
MLYEGEPMRRFVAVLVAALALALVAQNSALGGAKEGKTRWMNNKDTTGKYKVNPPIKVEAKSEVKLKIIFKANDLAEFFVIGDGDTDVDLFVYDSKGKLVGKDEDPAERGSDLCVVRWTPSQEEEFTIVIRNVDQKLYNTVTAGCN